MGEQTGAVIEERAKRKSLDRAPLGVMVNRFTRRHPEIGILIGLLILMSILVVKSPSFLTIAAITAMLTVAANAGIVALGACFLLVAREFDISVGSVYVISTLLFVTLANGGLAPPLAFLLTLVAGAFIGVINGVVTVKARIPSFIVTLAGFMGYRGLHVILTSGFTIPYKADRSFLKLIAGNPFSMFRNTIIWWLLIGLILHVILSRTKYGNWVFATGGDMEAARNVGVPVNRVKIINFALCSLLASLAGTLNMTRYWVSQAQIGMGMEFDAITAAVIGGAFLRGGRGSILGTILGTVFISVIRTGLIMLGYSSYLYMPVTGIILLLAVIVNRVVSRAPVQ